MLVLSKRYFYSCNSVFESNELYTFQMSIMAIANTKTTLHEASSKYRVSILIVKLQISCVKISFFFKVIVV